MSDNTKKDRETTQEAVERLTAERNAATAEASKLREHLRLVTLAVWCLECSQEQAIAKGIDDTVARIIDYRDAPLTIPVSAAGLIHGGNGRGVPS